MKRYALLGFALGLLLGVGAKAEIGLIKSPASPVPTILALLLGGYFAVSFARKPHSSSAFMAALFIACGVVLFI